jgi:hypothetical protein
VPNVLWAIPCRLLEDSYDENKRICPEMKGRRSLMRRIVDDVQKFIGILEREKPYRGVTIGHRLWWLSERFN